MCGITFASFTPTSSINIREIARTLLLGVENRGPQATGVAWVCPDDNCSVKGFNAAETASKFVASPRFRKMDDAARTFIGHTRFATKGSLDNHLNNHPVYAYDEASGDVVAAVHNGGVWNDDETFAAHRLTRYGQVDSEVIPAMIARYGSSAAAVSAIFNELEGGIATAWLDERVPGTLHCVRASDSPMVVMTLNLDTAAGRIDGVVGASTESALVRLLDSMSISPDAEGVQFYAIGEGEFFTVNAGVWDRMVIPFELPDLMTLWGSGWRGRNRATQTTHSTSKSSSSKSSASGMNDQAWGDSLEAEYGSVLGMAGYTASYDPATQTTTYVPTSSLMGRAAVLDDDPSDTDRPSPADAQWWEREALKSDLTQLAARIDADDDYSLSPADRVLIDLALDSDIDIEEMFGLPSEALDGTDETTDRFVMNYRTDSSANSSAGNSSDNADDNSAVNSADGMDAMTDRVSEAALAVVSKVIARHPGKVSPTDTDVASEPIQGSSGTGWPQTTPVEGRKPRLSLV